MTMQVCRLQRIVDACRFFKEDGRFYYLGVEYATTKYLENSCDYTQVWWWTADGDSYRPLVRAVRGINAEGKLEEASYG